MILLYGHEFKDLSKRMHAYPISGVMLKASRKETYFDFESTLLELKDTLKGGFIMHELEGELDQLYHDYTFIKPYLDADDYCLVHYSEASLAFVKNHQDLNVAVSFVKDYFTAHVVLSLGVRMVMIDCSVLSQTETSPLSLIEDLKHKNKESFKVIALVDSISSSNQALKAGADFIMINDTLFSDTIK